MRVIKKYPNRRLYDTETSSYVTISDVLAIIREGEDLQVVDAGSGEDITRSVLVQIIIDQENGESPIFTTEMLTRFIRVYDDASQNLFGELLERNINMFTDQQKEFQDQMGDIASSPLKVMKDLTAGNMAIWKDMQQSFFDMATANSSSKKDKEDKDSK